MNVSPLLLFLPSNCCKFLSLHLSPIVYLSAIEAFKSSCPPQRPSASLRSHLLDFWRTNTNCFTINIHESVLPKTASWTAFPGHPKAATVSRRQGWQSLRCHSPHGVRLRAGKLAVTCTDQDRSSCSLPRSISGQSLPSCWPISSIYARSAKINSCWPDAAMSDSLPKI